MPFGYRRLQMHPNAQTSNDIQYSPSSEPIKKPRATELGSNGSTTRVSTCKEKGNGVYVQFFGWPFYFLMLTCTMRFHHYLFGTIAKNCHVVVMIEWVKFELIVVRFWGGRKVHGSGIFVVDYFLIK